MADAPLLAELNHQLIRDEGHRNPMTVPELERRMRHWLGAEYQGTLFAEEAEVVAYALYCHEPSLTYLRQFFVHRQHRRQGIGRQAMQILFERVWPAGRRITVETLAHNSSAHAFWRAIGFADYAVTLESWCPAASD